MREISVAAVYPFDDDRAVPMGAETTVSTTKAHDATKLTLPLPIVAALVISAASLFGSVLGVGYMLSSQIKDQASAIGNINTRMEMQSQVDAANKRADSVILDNLSKTVDDLKRQTQLLSLQYAELSKTKVSR